jgi:DeoR family suf operon transcriptional repressor
MVAPVPPSTTTPARPAAPTREAALAELLRQGQTTAAELAKQLGVSVQVMRRHLRSLEEDGLVEASPAPEGPGRPRNLWQLTEAGRERFPDGSEHFALGLLHSMAASLPADTMRLLLRRQASDKASEYRRHLGEGPLPQRLERLVELRRDEGYVAECFADGGSGDAAEVGSWLLSEFHCSLLRIAEEFPVVCDQELQLLRHTFPDCEVERVHWRLESGHSCGFRLTPRAHNGADA